MVPHSTLVPFELASIFFLVSQGIRAGGVQLDGGTSPKHQGMALLTVQISTKATRLMVRVRGGVLEAF